MAKPTERDTFVLQAGQGQSCRQPGNRAAPGKTSVSIEGGLKEDELVKALQPLKDEHVLMFTDMRQAFGGFADPTDAERSAFLSVAHLDDFGVLTLGIGAS